MTDTLYNPGKEELESLLLGHSVTIENDDTLVLDNGTRLEVRPNNGCGGCTSGNYWIDAINGAENVITRVDTSFEEDDRGEGETTTIFVYSGAVRTELLSITGSEGNGYYGYGYELVVKRAAS